MRKQRSGRLCVGRYEIKPSDLVPRCGPPPERRPETLHPEARSQPPPGRRSGPPLRIPPPTCVFGRKGYGLEKKYSTVENPGHDYSEMTKGDMANSTMVFHRLHTVGRSQLSEHKRGQLSLGPTRRVQKGRPTYYGGKQLGEVGTS